MDVLLGVFVIFSFTFRLGWNCLASFFVYFSALRFIRKAATVLNEKFGKCTEGMLLGG